VGLNASTICISRGNNSGLKSHRALHTCTIKVPLWSSHHQLSFPSLHINFKLRGHEDKKEKSGRRKRAYLPVLPVYVC
jgi:hypothetical protein